MDKNIFSQSSGERQKPRILFFIPTLMHGGAEKVLVNLVNNLDRTKYDVTLYSIFDEGVNKRFLQPHITYRSRFKKVFRGNSQLMKLFSPKVLYRFFIKENYDIVVSYLEGPAARIISGCENSEIQKIAWIHSEMLNENLAKVGFRSLNEAKDSYSKFNVIAAVSKNVLDAFKNRFDLKSKMKVVYNVNETEQIVSKSKEPIPAFADEEALKICSVGKIIPVKGYDRLLEVHRRLLDEGIWHMIEILGIGAMKSEIEKKAERMGVSKSFRLLGYDKNPYKYIAKSDLYVCSSYREGFSTSVTEALILGVPVISALVSGAKELLGENNEFGIVTENSTEGLYIAMKELLSNPEKLRYYKDKAAERGSFFSTKKTVKEVENLFDSLLHE